MTGVQPDELRGTTRPPSPGGVFRTEQHPPPALVFSRQADRIGKSGFRIGTMRESVS
jgi:hypothetical protein